MNGILLVDKPAGWTSFDVVAKIRGIITVHIRNLHRGQGFCREDQNKELTSSAAKRTHAYVERATQSSDEVMTSQTRQDDGSAGTWRCRCRPTVGHSGTLDPFATGLLIILIGNATKAQDSFMKKDKWYDVSVLLGATSTTGDPEGEIMKSEKLKVIKLKEVKNALEDFIGEIQQIPPAYSAIKINGQRAYDLARQGKVVEMKSRRVTIHAIENVNYDFPHLSFSTHVSSGTYIRSLVRDIGKELGTGAYTAALRRTVIDTYHIEAACSIEELQTYDAIASRLLSL